MNFALQGDLHNYILGIMAIAAQGYFTLLAHRLYSAGLATLVARAEKDALIGELEQAKLISDDARRRAEGSNIAKSQFLAQMSHELRTPLNAILGFSEVMKTEVFGPHTVPAYKDYSNDIHNSGQHLLNLINEILDLSRIEAGRYELNEEPVSLTNVVEDCHHLLTLRAKNRGITIHEVFEPELPRLWADERALRQVCLNLLSNAIKFTPSGGEVWLKVGWTASGGQYMSVKDTGPGIPEEEIPVVLSKFGQGSNAIKSAEQGTGLGLPIAKNLIELHGGTFTLKSKVRIGTELIATFPPERVMAALPPLSEPAPPIQPQQEPESNGRKSKRSLFKHARLSAFACSAIAFRAAAPILSDAFPILTCSHHGRDRNALRKDLHRRSAVRALPRLRAKPCRDRALDRLQRWRAHPHHGRAAAAARSHERARRLPAPIRMRAVRRRLLWVLLIGVALALVRPDRAPRPGADRPAFRPTTSAPSPTIWRWSCSSAARCW